MRCPHCGRDVPAETLEQLGGICPACVAAHAMPTSLPTDAGTEIEPDRTSLKTGATFHGLEIVEVLGQGGMGIVYKARHPGLGTFVALKLLSPKLATDPEFARRFEREAKTLAKLDHPNIVRVTDFGREADLYFLVMEYVEGVSLRSLMREKRLSPPEALKIVPQICEALEYSHGEGVVHRDIKPENILLDRRGRVKIADFGLAKMVSAAPETSPVTRTDVAMGTPHYMAPEQQENMRTVDHRADIFSLGVVFYEMLTGELPVGSFLPPSKKVEIDVRLDEVVIKALAKEPERRYQRADEVRTDVETIVSTPPQDPSHSYSKDTLTFIQAFLKETRNVMDRARSEAIRRGHAFLGTEHILLGILNDPKCTANRILRELNHDPTSIAQQLEKYTAPSPDPVHLKGQIPFTPSAIRSIESAGRAAERAGSRWIGSEHLLLGLLDLPQCSAGQVLRNAGILPSSIVTASTLPISPHTSSPIPRAISVLKGLRLPWGLWACCTIAIIASFMPWLQFGFEDVFGQSSSPLHLGGHSAWSSSLRISNFVDIPNWTLPIMAILIAILSGTRTAGILSTNLGEKILIVYGLVHSLLFIMIPQIPYTRNDWGLRREHLNFLGNQVEFQLGCIISLFSFIGMTVISIVNRPQAKPSSSFFFELRHHLPWGIWIRCLVVWIASLLPWVGYGLHAASAWNSNWSFNKLALPNSLVPLAAGIIAILAIFPSSHPRRFTLGMVLLSLYGAAHSLGAEYLAIQNNTLLYGSPGCILSFIVFVMLTFHLLSSQEKSRSEDPFATIVTSRKAIAAHFLFWIWPILLSAFTLMQFHILAWITLVILMLVFSLSLLLTICALGDIRRNPMKLKGREIAISTLILWGVAVIGYFAWMYFFRPH